ncbi:RDD family protein [Nocardia sp. NPDC058497]|uniref:RDD family protein n=1 Tax=Nocardia sp. NPDC058497 TaxID=3346529 RepID=UPI00366927A9
MSDSGADQREAAALAKRYEQRPDGTLRLGPAVETDAQPVVCLWLVSASRADGSETGAIRAFLIDAASHIGIAVAVWWVLWANGNAVAVPLGICAWVAASFVHRTLIQRATRTTLGKAFFGLRLRYPDGSYPSLWRLILHWSATPLDAVAIALSFA